MDTIRRHFGDRSDRDFAGHVATGSVSHFLPYRLSGDRPVHLGDESALQVHTVIPSSPWEYKYLPCRLHVFGTTIP